MSEKSNLRNFFGKRNAEKNQEPSSSSCSESVKSETSQKPAPKKGQKFLSFWIGPYKWLRYENDLMFDSYIRPVQIPSRRYVLTSKILLLYKKMGPPFSMMGPPSQSKLSPRDPPTFNLVLNPGSAASEPGSFTSSIGLDWINGKVVDMDHGLWWK